MFPGEDGKPTKPNEYIDLNQKYIIRFEVILPGSIADEDISK